MPEQFVHLHVHSEYSLLDGMSRLGDLVARAKSLGMPALALTDHGALYGVIDFYSLCREAKIKPIVGVEAYVARNSRHDRDPKLDGHGKPWHLVLLAKDFAGYQALVQLVTAAHLEGYYYRPRMDKELLRKYAGHLIALSACLQGELARAIQDEGLDKACEVAKEHQGIFGEGNYYLELMSHGIPEQETVNAGIREVSRRTGVPTIATNDLHYVRAEDAEAQDIMVCIQSGKTVDTPDRLRMIDHPSLYMRTAAEMAALFPDDGEALANTLRVAGAVDLTLPLGTLRLPHFPVPGGRTPDQHLRAMAEAGVAARYGSVTPELRERVEKELGVIAKTGYAGYILIVQDFIRFAKERGILTAVRGSAGGSLVNYSIDLTDIDPLRYGLIFDRFLNLERYTQPDIDVDFMDNRRDEVIDYVTKKYGADHVAQIVTFNTMLARAAVRDVARVLGMPYGEADRVAKAMPGGPGAPTLAEARKSNPEIKELETQEHVSRMLDLAEKVEGLVRSTGTHAAGVVITREPLTELVPLERPKGKTEGIQTQFEDKQVDRLGLLKFDFLGLGNLTILDRALKLIERTRGVRIDREKIPLDDRKTYDLLSSGETTGLFQLESAGMRRYIRELRPDRVEDVMAMVALFRPGPMDYIPRYIARKRGLEAVTVPHPAMEPVLASTYGVMVYQEDVMAVTQALAGFTLGEADVLCYTIRKKIREKLDAQKGKFVDGALKKGVSRDVIETVWRDFEPFAQYGFNRAHAAIYGLIAYHTAYLKANYTPEYMTAVLSADMGNPDKIAIAVAECRRMGIEVLTPDVNESDWDFRIDGQRIRFGLGAVKNVGESAVESIVAARAASGPFRSLEDFASHIDLQRCNKRALESLIKCGATAAFGTRQAQLGRLEAALSTAQREQRDRASGQVGLFDLAGLSSGPAGPSRTEATWTSPAEPGPLGKAAIEASKKELLGWEKELLGIYLSEHPLQHLAERMGDVVTAYLAELKEANDDLVTIACVVTSSRRYLTKNKQLMLYAQVEDLTGSVEVTVFPRTYQETHQVWETDELLLVLARIEQRDDQPKLLCEHAVPFTDAGVEEIKRVAEERRAQLLRKRQFQSSRGSPPAAPGTRTPSPATGTNGAPRPTGPPAPVAKPAPEVVVRFREALDYERSVSLFKTIQTVLVRHAGGSPIVLELPRASGPARRVPTAFKVRASAELGREVEAAVGAMVEVILPETVST